MKAFLCSIDWMALGTWAVVAATSILVFWQNKIATRNSRGEFHRLFIERFDSLRKDRAHFAKDLLSPELREHRSAIRESVLNFFEDLGLYRRRGYLDEEMLEKSFAYYAVMWWAAIAPSIIKERARITMPDLYSDFEALVGRFKKTVQARWLNPAKEDVDDFLKEERLMT